MSTLRYGALGDVLRQLGHPDLEPERPDPWLENVPLPCTITRPESDYWHSDSPIERAHAGIICEGCPFKTACLERGFRLEAKFGIHGGWDFDKSHQNNRPAYCRNGHFLGDNNMTVKKGRYVHCLTCQRESNGLARKRNQEQVSAA